MTIRDFLALMIVDRNLALTAGTLTFQRHLPGANQTGIAACRPKEAIQNFLERNPGITAPGEITTLLEGAGE